MIKYICPQRNHLDSHKSFQTTAVSLENLSLETLGNNTGKKKALLTFR